MVDFSNMIFPNYFRIDYIRVYQNDEGTVGCDPAGEWDARSYETLADRRSPHGGLHRDVPRRVQQPQFDNMGCYRYVLAAFLCAKLSPRELVPEEQTKGWMLDTLEA